MVDKWISGIPPNSVEVAWLCLEAFHPDGNIKYVVLGCRDHDDDWSVAADWKGEGYIDPIEDVIVNWMPYSVPAVSK